MGEWNHIAESQIREAMESGAFDDLPGKGQPLDLPVSPFEDPLAATFRRILRDNGTTHPLIEARRAIEEEIASCRRRLEFAARSRGKSGSERAWEYEVTRFCSDAAALNREIKLHNLRTTIPNLALHTIDIERMIQELSG